VRWIDLLRFSLASLGHQKMRTCLTTLGVVFGTFVLAASLSINDRARVEQGRRLAEGDGLSRVAGGRVQGGGGREGRRADVSGSP